jgi:pimeloyl-ACP methyl ester carboxylesterase
MATTTFDNECNGSSAPAEKAIHAGGLRWHYLQWGDDGPPFVLFHGITASARTWWRVGPFLAERGFSVFAPDMPGHGQSDLAPDYRIETTARLLDAWMAAIDIRDPLILGHSWGGMNALVHATLDDVTVRPRLLLLEDPAMALAPNPDPYLPNYTSDLGTPIDEEALVAIAAANPRWHHCDVRWKAYGRLHAQRPAVEGFFRDNAGINVVARLHDLLVPTKLLLADPQTGGIWTGQYIEQIRREAPARVSLDIIENSGHNVHRDCFADFTAAVTRFVDEGD